MQYFVKHHIIISFKIDTQALLANAIWSFKEDTQFDLIKINGLNQVLFKIYVLMMQMKHLSQNIFLSIYS